MLLGLWLSELSQVIHLRRHHGARHRILTAPRPLRPPQYHSRSQQVLLLSCRPRLHNNAAGGALNPGRRSRSLPTSLFPVPTLLPDPFPARGLPGRARPLGRPVPESYRGLAPPSPRRGSPPGALPAALRGLWRRRGRRPGNWTPRARPGPRRGGNSRGGASAAAQTQAGPALPAPAAPPTAGHAVAGAEAAAAERRQRRARAGPAVLGCARGGGEALAARGGAHRLARAPRWGPRLRGRGRLTGLHKAARRRCGRPLAPCAAPLARTGRAPPSPGGRGGARWGSRSEEGESRAGSCSDGAPRVAAAPRVPPEPYRVSSLLSGVASPRLPAPLRRKGEPRRLWLLRLRRGGEEAFQKSRRLPCAGWGAPLGAPRAVPPPGGPQPGTRGPLAIPPGHPYRCALPPGAEPRRRAGWLGDSPAGDPIAVAVGQQGGSWT